MLAKLQYLLLAEVTTIPNWADSYMKVILICVTLGMVRLAAHSYWVD